MPAVALTTFLSHCSKSPSAKVAAYAKYLSPGGYDFYWRLKAQAKALTCGGRAFSDCEKVMQAIKAEIERKHNLSGLQALKSWIDKEGGTFFLPPSGTCASPLGHLTIKLEPEFGLQDSAGQRRLVTLWSALKPEMTPKVAAFGIYLMQKHLHKDSFVDCISTILGIRTTRWFSTLAMPADVAFAVEKELAWVDWFFESHGKGDAADSVSAVAT